VSVGKTTIAAKYCSNSAAQDYGPTVGGVYYKKESADRSGDTFTQNIWDTAGEEKFRSMASLYPCHNQILPGRRGGAAGVRPVGLGHLQVAGLLGR
jgi:hypothetical protein